MPKLINCFPGTNARAKPWAFMHVGDAKPLPKDPAKKLAMIRRAHTFGWRYNAVFQTKKHGPRSWIERIL